MGAYIVLYPRAKVPYPGFPNRVHHFLVATCLAFPGYWFLIQFIIGAATTIAETSQSTGGVAVWAHVGGFLAGIVLIKLMPARPRRFSYGYR
jgi:membrane associated rhomboid family serine protease